MQTVRVVLGGPWGDQGKGKIVDCLAADVDLVARFQGGANAGNTVKWETRSSYLICSPPECCTRGCAAFLERRWWWTPGPCWMSWMS